MFQGFFCLEKPPFGTWPVVRGGSATEPAQSTNRHSQ